MSVPHSPPPSVAPAAFGAGAALVAAAAVWLTAREADQTLGFRVDDAWIHLVYARSLWENGMLSYNDGIPATGATSPGWACLLALAYGASRSTDGLVWLVNGIGVSCFVACGGLAGALGHRLGRGTAGWLAAAAVACCTPLAAASFSGMEVTLTAAALLAAVHSTMAERPIRAGVAYAVAIAARPESGLVFLGALILAARGPRNAMVRLAAPVVVLLGIWASYAVWATGTPFPATFLMKASPSEGWLVRLVHVGWMLLRTPPVAWGIGLLGLLGLLGQASRPVVSGPLVAAVLFVAANTLVIHHVDVNFYHLRYLLPAFPLLLVAVACGWAALGRIRHRAVPWVFGGLCAVTFLGSVTQQSRSLHNDTRNINEVQRAMGEWLRDHTTPGQRIAATDAGAVRFFSERETIDLLGLNTPELVWEGAAWAETHPVTATATMPAWVDVSTAAVLSETARFETDRYTVTAFPEMANQVVHWCTSAGPVHLDGVVTATVWCDPTGR